MLLHVHVFQFLPDFLFATYSGVVVIVEKANESVLVELLAPESDLLKGSLDRRDPFGIPLAKHFGISSFGSYRGNVFLIGNRRPEILEKPHYSSIPHGFFVYLVEWNDDVELLFHDLCHIDEVRKEVHVPVGLLLEEGIRLLERKVLELEQVAFDIHLERTDDDLDREPQGVEKPLVSVDDGILFFLALEVEVHRLNLQDHSGRAILHNHAVSPNLTERKVFLGG